MKITKEVVESIRQNFKKYDINDWKENIIEEFGNETFLNLHKKIEEIDKFSLGDVKIKFTVSEGTLTGRWKEGKDAGPMRGN